MANLPSRYARVLAWLDQTIIRRLYNEQVRRIILQSLPFWVASVVTGLVAVGYEKLFVWAEDISARWLTAQPLLAFLVVPAAFVASWFLVYAFAPAARGSGIPQVRAGTCRSGRGG